MSRNVTMTSLLQRVRQRANLEGATAFLPDSELQELINESYADWYDMVRMTTWGGQYYRSSSTFSTVGNVSQYALPADFLSLISLDIGLGTSLFLSALPYQEEQRNTYRLFPGGWSYPRPVYYQIQGQYLNFIPTPQGAVSATLNYYPVCPTLSGDADALDDVNGWSSWIVLDSAVKALTKDGQLDIIPLLQQERDRQAQRIQAAAANRDAPAERVHERQGDFVDDIGWGY